MPNPNSLEHPDLPEGRRTCPILPGWSKGCRGSGDPRGQALRPTADLRDRGRPRSSSRRPTVGLRAQRPTRSPGDVDARDRYAKHVVAAGSEFNSTSDPKSSSATTPSMRSPKPMLPADRKRGGRGRRGRSMIPRFTQAYRIGDRICSIQGREPLTPDQRRGPDRGGRNLPGGGRFDLGPSMAGSRRLLQLSDQRGQYRDDDSAGR